MHYWNELKYCYEKATKIVSVFNKKEEVINGVIDGELDIGEFELITNKKDYKVNRQENY